jgi:hypothetical protein
MHHEPLDPRDLSAPEDSEDLSLAAANHLDQRITRALEAAPEPYIPADFAARVAGRLPARRPVSLTQTHYGQNATLLGILVTLAALILLALHATGHASFVLLESLLFAQFVALAVWFSVWRHGLR